MGIEGLIPKAGVRTVRLDAGVSPKKSCSDYWIYMGGLGYRAAAGLAPPAVLALTEGTAVTAVVVVALLVCVADAVGLRWLYRRARVDLDLPRRYAIVDAVALVLLSLWASAHVPGSLGEPFRAVLWNQAQGAVAMWFGLYGFEAAAGVVLAGALLSGAMIRVNGRVASDAVLSLVVTQTSWMVLALLATLAVKALLDGRGRAALDEGVETGQELQRLRHLREVHDTVLQTLEGIALYASVQHVDERQRLEGVAEAARAEARQLRERLRATDAEPDQRLDAQLAACVEHFRGRGLRIDLEVPPGDRPATLPDTARAALRDATFEALTNVVKHADAGHVRVRLTDDVDGVEVLVEDDGRGFDPSSTRGTFGIGQSIRSRLADVGGSAHVSSSPGAGTQVRLGVRAPDGAARITAVRRRRSSADPVAIGRHRR